MISCKECKERLFPHNPTIRLGKYRLSTCEHYCNKPQYYRELEQIKSEIQPVFRLRPVDKEIDQLNEHLDKKNRDRI